jgi:hypothetical protein
LASRSTNRDEGATSTRRSIPPNGHPAENFEGRLFRLLSTRRQERVGHGFQPCRLKRHLTKRDEGAAIAGAGPSPSGPESHSAENFEAACSALLSARRQEREGHGFQPWRLNLHSTNRDEGAATADEWLVLLRGFLFALSMLRCPSLRCAQGRPLHLLHGRVAMLPTQLLSFHTNPGHPQCQ